LTVSESRSIQESSAGTSVAEIHDAAIAAASPAPGLCWLDIGCGRGEALRIVRDRWAPGKLTGIDLIEWLDPDLSDDVTLIVGPAERAISQVEPADRVLLIETIEHLEAPWTVLRSAASLVRTGGLMVVTTPNIGSLRHRLELLVRGQLTSFRPSYPGHLTPVVPHVARMILEQEDLVVSAQTAVRDIIPLTGGKRWPTAVHNRALNLTSLVLLMVGEKPGTP
jgi:2-polyprenyl-3-methyl-5-hydroxy-6-metoxy-1,4-benzoquinol methylase